jgi:hypothetical protein
MKRDSVGSSEPDSSLPRWNISRDKRRSGDRQDASFAVSDTGVLVYAARTRAPGRLTWLDRAGRPTGVLGDVQDYVGSDDRPMDRPSPSRE